VLTGIMRVAKESIFSGLNNLGVFTLLSHSFADKFGLTEPEVKQMVRDFGIEKNEQEINNWYNGYIFGEVVIYNPWSIINYLNNTADGFKPYWLNTSDNAIVEQLLTRNGQELRQELESLIRSESVEKPIEENIVFAEIEHRDDLLWSFLLFGGYLKYVERRVDELDPSITLAQLTVPNLEVRGIFTRLIRNWFERRFENKKLEIMLKALIGEDLETFEELFAELVESSFSYLDPGGQDAEKVYQAFAIGLLVWLSGRYEVKSNREAGFGRFDVMLIPRDLQRKDTGVIIEFKKVNKRRGETKENAFAKAFAQIEEKNYARELLERGIQRIRNLAIVFEGKQVWVRENTDG
ncbi:MAG: AAA family ATPase, partial [bacterium]